MATLPAVCDRCNAVFPSGFGGGGGATMIMYGCRSGPCPECGAMGSVPDGEYSLHETLIKFLSGPQSSYEKLAHVAETIRSMQASGASAEDVLRAVGKTSPALAWFGSFFGKEAAHLYFGTLVSLVTLLQSCNQDADIEDAVRRGVLEGMRQYSELQVQPSEPSPQSIEIPSREGKNDNAGSGHDRPSPPRDEDEKEKDNRWSDYI